MKEIQNIIDELKENIIFYQDKMEVEDEWDKGYLTGVVQASIILVKKLEDLKLKLEV